MEVNDIAFDYSQIEDGDLDLRVSFALICQTNLGSAVALRNFLYDLDHYRIVRFQLSSQKIYFAKWHELNEEKQNQIRMSQRGKEEKHNTKRRY